MLQLTSYVIFTVIILIVAKTYLDKKGHPKGLFYLFFAEMWERFSFYGMRALLTLYLIKDYYSHIENNEEIAYGIYASYGALVYLTPLIGGYLADKYIGYRKSILYGGVLMALGHFFMAFPSDTFFYGALALLIMGNGFFKPNISTLVGSLYKDGDIKRDGGFTIFYMVINLGAMIAPLFCGYLGEVYGWHYGFGAAGIGMLAGLIVFWKGISNKVLGENGLQPKEYINKKIAGLSLTNFIYTLGFIAVPVFAFLIIYDAKSKVLGNVLSIVGGLVLLYLAYIIYDYIYNKKDKKSGQQLIAIIILAIFCTIFWACFEQAGSSITVWVDKCVNLVGLNASQTNAINPGYIVLLAIPFSYLWTKLGSINRNPNTAIKFSLGILQLGLGFLVFAVTTHFIGDNGKVPFLFVFLGYFLITTGELFLSPIGLSKVTELSPKRMISFMMGVWFLSSTFAHYISGGIAKMTTKPFYKESNYFVIDNDNNDQVFTFDLDYDFNYTLKNIKLPEFPDSSLSVADKKIISQLISRNLIDNHKKDFKWSIGDKNKLEISPTKDIISYSKDDEAQLNELFEYAKNGLKTKKSKDSFVEKIANIFPWNFISIEETNTKNHFDLEILSKREQLIFLEYNTDESIIDKKDAIAGLSFISSNGNLSWNNLGEEDDSSKTNYKSLEPGKYSYNITVYEDGRNVDLQTDPVTSDGFKDYLKRNGFNDEEIDEIANVGENITPVITITREFEINKGANDWLSKISYAFMGNINIENKSIATLIQYNSVYTKIGFVTIFIALFVAIISPFIKKLMHDVH